jgi:hypothetical protein
MSNLDNPHGLNAIRMLNGGKIPMNRYPTSATTVVYQGDVVCLRANGLVATLKTTGGAANILGVAASYGAVSDEVWVYDDARTVFEIQSDGATDPGSTTAVAQVGNTCSLILTAGTAATKRSNHEIDYSSITTGTADPLQIVGFYQGVDNDKTLAHARYLVLLKKNVYENVPESYSAV